MSEVRKGRLERLLNSREGVKILGNTVVIYECVEERE